MKRFGYTLAEALIALTLIGVITAIVAPMASKFMPDTNKILFLKTYDAVAETSKLIASNSDYYPSTNGTPSIDNRRIYNNAPLNNTAAVTVGGVTYGGDIKKYCQLLAHAFGVESPSCSSAFQNSPNVNEAPSFVTKNGTQFWVYSRIINLSGLSSEEYQSNVFVDVDGTKGVNCSYNATTCPNPDRFLMAVNTQGDIAPFDIKARQHILSRANLRTNKIAPTGEIKSSDPWENGKLYFVTRVEEIPAGYFQEGVLVEPSPDPDQEPDPQTPTCPAGSLLTLDNKCVPRDWDDLDRDADGGDGNDGDSAYFVPGGGGSGDEYIDPDTISNGGCLRSDSITCDKTDDGDYSRGEDQYLHFGSTNVR